MMSFHLDVLLCLNSLFCFLRFQQIQTSAELSFEHCGGRRHFGGGMVSVSIREYKLLRR